MTAKPSIGTQGKALIMEAESLSLTPYRCPAGVWTIGYGATRDLNGKPVTRNTLAISHAQALALFDRDCAEAETAIYGMVKVALTQGQIDALGSFVFNLGAPALRASTLLKKLNAGDFEGAATEFSRWVYSTDPATHQKVKLAGLGVRRRKERDLFVRAAP